MPHEINYNAGDVRKLVLDGITLSCGNRENISCRIDEGCVAVTEAHTV